MSSEFKCVCKKPCKEGECKDPKRVKQGILVDSEQLALRTIQVAAVAAHEANRVYCESIGDDSLKPWVESPQWQRDSAIQGVLLVRANPGITSEQQHSMWLAHKRAEGWVLGPVKDEKAKVHPCMLPYNDLPEAQKTKDKLFGAIVRAVLFGTEVPGAE